MRPVITEVVNKFLECGDLEHGFARIRCDQCKKIIFWPFPAKGAGSVPPVTKKWCSSSRCLPIHQTGSVTEEKKLRVSGAVDVALDALSTPFKATLHGV